MLQKLDKILVPHNPPDDDKNNMGNIDIEQTKEDGLDGEKDSSGTKCCSNKIEKQVVPVRVALLQSTDIWVGDSGASVHSTNERCRGSNMCKGNGAGTIGAHDRVITASSIMDIAGTWCNTFGKEQLKAMLKDVQYNPKSILTCSVLGKPSKKLKAQ